MWKKYSELTPLRFVFHTFVLVLLIFAGGTLYAQVRTEGSRLIDAKLLMQGTEINNEFIFINYEIPYSGMVEIRLYDGSGQQIWRNQYDRPHGKNRIVLRASKLTPGETYAYQLNYKRDMIRETITLPGSPH